MGRPVEKLSALQVERKSKKPGLYGDGGGLALRVTSQTACSWVFRYMLNGTPREMGLGPYPDVTLARAREKAQEARRLKADGLDPLTQRESVRAAQRLDAARAITFRDAAEQYIAAHKDGWSNAKHADQWPTTLETYAYQKLGALPVGAIDTTLVHSVLEPIWKAKTETASRVRSRIEAILDWSTTRGYRQGENPARWRGHLEHLFPARTKVQTVKHLPALPYRELPTFMARLGAEEGLGAQALRFTILTAARTNEVAGMAWTEIDFDNAVWAVPASRMKSKREHRVPLCKHALAILCERRAVTGGQGYVFPGKRKRPLSNKVLLKTLRRVGSGESTVHGFRSTFRDWAAEQTAFPREVAEAALAHVKRSGARLSARRSIREAAQTDERLGNLRHYTTRRRREGCPDPQGCPDGGCVMTISERDCKSIGRLVRKYGPDAVVALARNPPDAKSPGRPRHYPTNRAMIWAHVEFRRTPSIGRKLKLDHALSELESDLKRWTVNGALPKSKIRSMYNDAKAVLREDAVMRSWAAQQLANLRQDATQTPEGRKLITVPLLQVEEGAGITVSTIPRFEGTSDNTITITPFRRTCEETEG